MKCGSSLVLPLLVSCGLSALSGVAHAYTINTTEVGKRIRWSVDSVRLKVDPEFDNFLNPGQARSALDIGLEAWRGLSRVPDLVTEPGMPESLGHHDGHASNGVYLLRDWPYEPTKLAVTIVTYEMDTGRLLDADVVVNGKARYALLDEPVQPGVSSYDLAGVLTHEAGHVLGLGESNEGEDATMWPYARPDDTEKRTLAQDDEDGVIESYLSAPPPASSSCGGNTITGRASGRGGLVLSLYMLATIAGVWVTRRRPRWLGVLALGTLSTFAVGFTLPKTVPSAAQTKLLLLEQLAREGTRDDQSVLETLQSGSDVEIARRAHVALGLVRARPALARIRANTPEGTQRLARLLGSGSQLQVGKAKPVATVERSGLLFTDYEVTTSTGRVSPLRVAGGIRDGIAQRVMDAEPPPAADQEVVVAQQADGSQHWAYHSQGTVFGGALGEGPAIEGAL
jgi:hypothetical protein